MLLPKPIAEGIRDGRITLAYRRWDAPRVKVGSTQLTMIGVVAFDACDEIADVATISDDDATAAGFASADVLRQRLAPVIRKSSPRGAKGGDKTFRVRLRFVGEDPRVALRAKVPSGDELETLVTKVAKLDAGKKSGPWTTVILQWIRDNPEVVSSELATLLDRDLLPMKADIRKLKALGLTESFTVGYRLSPRGETYLAAVDTR